MARSSFQLNRFSVLPSLYELSPQNTAVKLNPFSWHSDFVFDDKLASARWSIVDDLIGAMVIDPKELLGQAWRKALADGLTEAEWQRLTAMPISASEALDLAMNQVERSSVSQSKAQRVERVRPCQISDGNEATFDTARVVQSIRLGFDCLRFGYVQPE